jgi:multimeric flavodoxin WrbA
MKVLGIVCSPRAGGNTEIMMNEALTGARSLGAKTELWTTANKEL